jgi:hypothetical protein
MVKPTHSDPPPEARECLLPDPRSAGSGSNHYASHATHTCTSDIHAQRKNLKSKMHLAPDQGAGGYCWNIGTIVQTHRAPPHRPVRSDPQPLTLPPLQGEFKSAGSLECSLRLARALPEPKCGDAIATNEPC